MQNDIETSEKFMGLIPTPTRTDFKSRGPNSKQVGIDNLMKIPPKSSARTVSPQLTLFAEVSHASLFRLPGSEEERKTTVSSGLKCYESLPKSTPLLSLVKMFLDSSIWHSTKCYLTWKISATKRQRLLYRLVPSTPHTGETGSLLLPTARAREGNCGDGAKGIAHGVKKGYLDAKIAMLPTPPTTDCTTQGLKDGYKREHSIASVAERLSGMSLGLKLRPNFVEWMMSFPIGWTDLNVSETQLYHKSPTQSE